MILSLSKREKIPFVLSLTKHLACCAAKLKKLLSINSKRARAFLRRQGYGEHVAKLPSSPNGYSVHGRPNGVGILQKLCATIFYLIIFSHTLHSTVTTFIPRSQSVNAAREMVGWQQLINRCDTDGPYGVFSITPEYTQSFNSCKLAQCLFGTTQTNGCHGVINISGSFVQNRGENDWLADFLGVGEFFEGTLLVCPEIKNYLVDFNYYQGFDCGLYFRIHAPLVNTRWRLRTNELVISPGVAYFEGYFNALGTLNIVNNALEFLSGLKTPNLNVESVRNQCDQTYLFQKLQYSKFSSDGCGCKELTRTALSDIEAALGWNFVCCDDYVVGLNVRASAPTGGKPCPEFFFSPLIADGGHWKLGAGLNAQYIWQLCEGKRLGFFLDARVQHLFTSCQTRTFDLKDKPNSRYMTALRLGANRLPVHITGVADAGVEFQNEYAPIANLSTMNVNVSIAVETDIALKFSYITDCLEFDLGYEFWGRSCEKICKKTGCTPSALRDNTWALKGDAQVVGFTTEAGDDFSCVRLAPSQHNATIHDGTNGASTNVEEFRREITNPGIDNPILLTAANAGQTIISFPPGLTTRSSNPVVYLTEADLDLKGSKGLSNKLFAHASYTWKDCECYTPFVGVGGEVEWAQSSCKNGTSCTSGASTSCSGCCPRCALSQWGLWLKGGIAFN